MCCCPLSCSVYCLHKALLLVKQYRADIFLCIKQICLLLLLWLQCSALPNQPFTNACMPNICRLLCWPQICCANLCMQRVCQSSIMTVILVCFVEGFMLLLKQSAAFILDMLSMSGVVLHP